MAVTSTTPSDADMAACRAKLGSDDRGALADVRSLLQRTPDSPKLLRIAAAAHRGLGESANAERAELAAIQASARVPALAAAAAQMNVHEFGEASRIAAQHLRDEPDDLAAMTLSAEAAIALGVAHNALPLLEDVLKRTPSFLRARVLFANALMLTDRLHDALRIVRPLVERRPSDAELLNMLSRIQSDLGDYAEAIKANEKLVKIDAKSPDALANLGDSLRFNGQREEALKAYRQAIAKDSAHGRAWWSIADMAADTLTHDDIARIAKALAQRSDEPEHAGNLHFASGIVFDARGDAQRAFDHFSKGNQLRRSAQPYDPDDITSQVDRNLDAFNAASVPTLETNSYSGLTPIFVLGMPRAGSTLVERMLGQHSEIEALGELAIVPRMVERIRHDVGDQQVAATVAGLSGRALESMGQWYIARARERMHTDSKFFVDKLHMNWRHLPLILRMLPQARIIDIRRGAMDCCWSNFKTLFSRGHPAANDLRDIGRFYRDYVRQTDELRSYAPGRVHLQSYEALVGDIDGQAEAMFAALNIAFEQEVLEFHLSQAPVATASSEQVRRPLNSKGIGRWQDYGQWLEPLRQELGELAEI